MKRFVLQMLLMFLLFFSIAGLASANGGPHGDFTATDDGCAGCHRAHTATGNRLLVASSTQALCETCHGSTATGAQTNVIDGVYAQYNDGGGYSDKEAPGSDGTVGAGLNGGGFSYAYDPVDEAFEACTSNHDTSGSASTSWGAGGVIGEAASFDGGIPLTCASCHDPHGSPNYRIIKPTVNGVLVSVPDSDASTKSYTDESWEYGLIGDETASVSRLCAACHGAYHVTTGGAGSSGQITHRVDVSWDGDGESPAYVGFGRDNPETDGFSDGSSPTFYLPLADDMNSSTPDDILLCTTCHFSHGSAAQMASGPGTWSEDATLPDVPGGDGDSSALLRLDNRGVCEVCHQK